MKKNGFFPGVGPIVPVIIVLAVLAGCTSKQPAPVVVRGPGVPTQAARGETYTVKQGDTLYSIARAHGMDYHELSALNDIKDPDQIAVGYVLRLRRAEPSAPEKAVTMPVISGGVLAARPIGSPGSGRLPAEENSLLKREPKAGRLPYSEQALAEARTGEQPPPAVQTGEPPAPVAQTGPVPAAGVEPRPVVKPPAASSAGKGPWIWPASGKVVTTFDGNSNKGIDIAGRAGDPVVAAGNGRVVYVGMGLRGYGKLVIVRHDATFLSAYAHNQNILVKEGQSVTQGQRIAEMGNTDADRVKLHFEIRSTKSGPVDPLRYLPRR
jgi:lipoprotein NlpD